MHVSPDDNGEEVPTGEIGELAIKAKNVTPGYWNKPAETAKAFMVVIY